MVVLRQELSGVSELLGVACGLIAHFGGRGCAHIKLAGGLPMDRKSVCHEFVVRIETTV